MTPTVLALFRRLEQSGIRYAMLRNYQQLLDAPQDQKGQATDIDLVIATEDISKWRHIAISLAQEFGWDALTECEHFTQSSERAHHIEIFRFYRHADSSFLQIDVFHAYLIWGLPFCSERDMLANRVSDAAREITRIHPLKENTFRLLQIKGLIGSKHARRKIARYRERVLRFDAEHGREFRGFLNSHFAGCANHVLDALEREDWACFARIVRRAKASFWIGCLRRNPWGTLRLVSARVIESRKRYFTNSCGRVVEIHANTMRMRGQLQTVLDELQRLNFIDQWSERDSAAVREQGGLVIQWTSPECADIVLDDGYDPQRIRRSLIDLLIRRHQPLFIRSEAGVPIRTCREALVRA